MTKNSFYAKCQIVFNKKRQGADYAADKLDAETFWEQNVKPAVIASIEAQYNFEVLASGQASALNSKPIPLYIKMNHVSTVRYSELIGDKLIINKAKTDYDNYLASPEYAAELEAAKAADTAAQRQLENTARANLGYPPLPASGGGRRKGTRKGRKGKKVTRKVRKMIKVTRKGRGTIKGRKGTRRR